MGPHNIAALGDGLTVLCGPNPPDDNTLRSERLQVLHWRVDTPFTDPVAHRHTSSDEVYIVIDGILTLDMTAGRDGRSRPLLRGTRRSRPCSHRRPPTGPRPHHPRPSHSRQAHRPTSGSRALTASLAGFLEGMGTC